MESMKDWQEIYTEIKKELRLGLGSRSGSHLNFHGRNLESINERHLHHQFSTYLSDAKKINVFGSILNSIIKIDHNLTLFPEYPTSKVEVTRRPGIWYYKKHPDTHIPAYRDIAPHENRGGQPVGHLDFVIGHRGNDFFEPDIAVEFKLGPWFKEEVAFDYLKLLDPRMNYQACISVCITTGRATASNIPPVFRAEPGTPSAIDIFNNSLELSKVDLKKPNPGIPLLGVPIGRKCCLLLFDWLNNGEIDAWEFNYSFENNELGAQDEFLNELRNVKNWIHTRTAL